MFFTIPNNFSIDFKNGCGGGFCILTAVCVLFPSHVHRVSLAVSAELRYAFFGLCFSVSDELSVDFNEIWTWSRFERYALWLARSGGRVNDERVYAQTRAWEGMTLTALIIFASNHTSQPQGRCLFVMHVTPPACDGPPAIAISIVCYHCPLSLLSAILCRRRCL